MEQQAVPEVLGDTAGTKKAALISKRGLFSVAALMSAFTPFPFSL
jgi:hypothetical protein